MKNILSFKSAGTVCTFEEKTRRLWFFFHFLKKLVMDQNTTKQPHLYCCKVNLSTHQLIHSPCVHNHLKLCIINILKCPQTSNIEQIIQQTPHTQYPASTIIHINSFHFNVSITRYTILLQKYAHVVLQVITCVMIHNNFFRVLGQKNKNSQILANWLQLCPNY